MTFRISYQRLINDFLNIIQLLFVISTKGTINNSLQTFIIISNYVSLHTKFNILNSI